MTDWLSVRRGEAPLIISIPHAGTHIPDDIAAMLVSLPLALRDADYHVDLLYGFAADLGATVIQTAMSRAVIDVNRDPSGHSLYPGQATTGLCPETDFDGTPLYVTGREPLAAEFARRQALYFDPYHSAIRNEVARLRELHGAIVLFDAHSIRGRVPRLFDGELPQFNIGTFDGRSCAPELAMAVARCCAHPSTVIDGRFKGGWITRHYGDPANGLHAIQMELAMRGYVDEAGPWPPVWDPERAHQLQAVLRDVVGACLDFAKDRP